MYDVTPYLKSKLFHLFIKHHAYGMGPELMAPKNLVTWSFGFPRPRRSGAPMRDLQHIHTT